MASAPEHDPSGQGQDGDPQSRSESSGDGRVSPEPRSKTLGTSPSSASQPTTTARPVIEARRLANDEDADATEPSLSSVEGGARTLASSQAVDNVSVRDHGHKRKRGYSLRRSIFAQNVQRKGDMEMRRPGTSSDRAVNLNSSLETRRTTITIGEPVRDKGEMPVHSMDVDQNFHAGQTSHSTLFTTFNEWWRSLWNTMLKPKTVSPSLDGRRVRVNGLRSVDVIDERTGRPHINNMIISCRYTPWNFVPRQLVAQFGKLANFYFLCISILQMIPGLSTTGTFTTIVPLLIFVGLSMAKEGYDDLRRHRLDKEENEREVFVLEKQDSSAPIDSQVHADTYPSTASTGWRADKWQNVRVADVVLLLRDEPVPADVVLLHSVEPTGSAYVETKSLDGETNLKTKKPLPDVSSRCQDLDSVINHAAEFVVEDPNLDLYKFDGRLSIADVTLPLTNNEVVYRGSVIRNTSAALGLVIYSGEECKIRMNANKRPRIKAPALQAAVNRVVIFIAALVFSIGFLMSGLYEAWRQNTENTSWYLEAARVPFGHVFTSYVIMFNTMLPLSLYVSMEIVKIAQIFMMNDLDLYDPETDRPMEPHTSTINEELGQVSYIFSDKTGTLTNNSMKFRKISIAGMAWLHDRDIQDETLNFESPKLSHEKRGSKSKGKVTPSRGAADSAADSNYTGATMIQKQNLKGVPSTDVAESPDCDKTEQLLDYLQRKPHSVYARKAKFFILALALCHTCIPEKDAEGNIIFQAASPDELALVNAAQELGYTVTDRQPKSITIKTYMPDNVEAPIYEVYEVLDIIEFSSARKRMSIVIRLPDRRLCLFTKGADTTIRQLLRLSELADTSASTVRRRASQRKSLEAEQMLRRRSSLLQTGLRRSASSISIADGSTGAGQSSTASASKRPSARDSLDQRLKDRVSEVDLFIPSSRNSFYTPRQSFQHQSPRPSGAPDARPVPARTTSSRSSVQAIDVVSPVDEAVAVNDAASFERCFQHIDDFATEGLRTLLYGYRFVPEEEYKEWQNVYSEASTSLENRQEKMEAVGEMIETKLELLGATAIEDKLQKGVPDAIDRFRRAGIKMWMLTGDKRETAINIGYSCRLVKDYSTVITLDHEIGELHKHMVQALAAITSHRVAHSVLVIDGHTLTVIDKDPSHKAIFTDIAISAESVICCRASPSQKASLVKVIRTKVKRSVTLAIGDGANDIAMIQEAHVGIGIAGKEGLQAARTSDYSIAQFRFLVKLLLVHGRWNYVRLCKYTLGTFWKEMIFYLVQAMYQWWNGYTGQSLYEPWSLAMFNTLFTSLPVIFLGVFEKDLAASTLLAVPELYNIGRCHKGFSFAIYAWWAFMGAVEAVIVYFVMYSIYGEAVFTRDNRLYAMGCLAFSICVISISAKLQVIELHNKTVTAIFAVVVSVGGWWVWNLILSGTYNKYDAIYDVNQGIIQRFGRNPLWWLTLLIGVMAVVLFEVVVKMIRTAVRPSDVDQFQALEHDLEMRKRFEDAASDLLEQSWNPGTKKSGLHPEREAQEQAEREAQVQELLNRPRTLKGATSHAGAANRSSGQAESDEVELLVMGQRGARETTTQRSVDVSELFSKGFGKVKQGQELR